MQSSPTEQQALQAADDRAAVEAFVSTLSARQAQQITTILLALGAANPQRGAQS